MSDAGYDPSDALSIWQRMADDPRTSSAGALQFLSTHPPTVERLTALKALLPQAEARYRSARGEKRPAAAEGWKNEGINEPDSFVIGRDDHLPPPPPREPSSRRSVRGNKWFVVEPSAVIRAAPREESERIAHVRRGEILVVEGRVGRWYEVVAPARGYIEGVNISPR
jgi:hypothetical protein